MADSETWAAFAALATVIFASMGFGVATTRRIVRGEAERLEGKLGGKIAALRGELTGEIRALRGEVAGVVHRIDGLDRAVAALTRKVMESGTD